MRKFAAAERTDPRGMTCRCQELFYDCLAAEYKLVRKENEMGCASDSRPHEKEREKTLAIRANPEGTSHRDSRAKERKSERAISEVLQCPDVALDSKVLEGQVPSVGRGPGESR